MEHRPILPNLFLVGAPKAGTTTVYRWLSEHPDVFFPPRKKEPAFFAGFHGQSWSGPGAERFVDYIVGSQEEYLSLYDDAGGFRWRGDASSDYLWRPSVPAAIEASCGDSDLRIVVILRNPVTRAFSEHCHLIRDGLERASLEESFQLENERFESGWQPLFYHYKRGAYSEGLERYFETFGRDRVKVLLYEDLEQEPRVFMQEVFEFLNLAPIEFSAEERHNVSGVTKNRWLHRALQANHLFKSAVKRLVGSERSRRIRLALERRNLKPLQMSEGEQVFLLEVFREDIGRVERLLDRDLSRWTLSSSALPSSAPSSADEAES